MSNVNNCPVISQLSFCFLRLPLTSLFSFNFNFYRRHTRFVSQDLKMRYVAAYLLAVLGGNASPSAADVEKILGSVGVEAEAEKVKKVLGELNGKSIEELITKGREKLSSMPVGGAAPVAAAAVAAAPAAAEQKKEAKKEEKKVESESEDDDMGFGLFD